MTAEKVPHFLGKSLANLQLNYVDLYHIHTPTGFQYQDDSTLVPMKNGTVLFDTATDLEVVWKALETEVDARRVRSLGVSNFTSEQVERLCKTARHMPTSNQVELHAYFQQKRLREFCINWRITICSYAAVGSPGRKTVYETKGL